MDADFHRCTGAPVRTFEALVQAEFSQGNTYLNTAGNGLLPAGAVAAMLTSIESMAAGRPQNMFEDLEAARFVFARLAGVSESRVAAGAWSPCTTG